LNHVSYDTIISVNLNLYTLPSLPSYDTTKVLAKYVNILRMSH